MLTTREHSPGWVEEVFLETTFDTHYSRLAASPSPQRAARPAAKRKLVSFDFEPVGFIVDVLNPHGDLDRWTLAAVWLRRWITHADPRIVVVPVLVRVPFGSEPSGAVADAPVQFTDNVIQSCYVVSVSHAAPDIDVRMSKSWIVAISVPWDKSHRGIAGVPRHGVACREQESRPNKHAAANFGWLARSRDKHFPNRGPRPLGPTRLKNQGLYASR